AESVNRLATHAAKPWTQAVCWFSVRSRRRPERRCQSSLAALAYSPCPSEGRASASRQSACQTISGEGMRSPIGFNREPWRRGYERPAKGPCEDGRRKDCWQGLGEARERPSVPFCLLGLPIRHAAAPSHLHSDAEG